LIGHDLSNKPVNGTRPIRFEGSRAGMNRRFNSGQGPPSGEGGNDKKGVLQMFQGQFDLDAATPVEATAIPDVLFERGLYWASGRSGVVNLVAAHKWFNLAALKGRADAISMRREVAEMMSEAEIATAQREARAWMISH
jgi:TPR repeat protein